jgi:general stress protein 26
VADSDVAKIVGIMRKCCLHAYLATCDGDRPRVRPVSPIVENDLAIWVTTYRSSRKVRQIQVNPNVCLAFVEQPRGDAAAVVEGEAVVIDDASAKERVWGMAPFDLKEHFPDGSGSEEFCLLKIVVRRIEWREGWTSGTNVYEPA